MTSLLDFDNAFRSVPPGPLVGARVPEGFDSRPYELFGLAPVSRTIGAEVRGVRLSGEISSQVLAELRRALLEWKVLFFRDQDIARNEQRDFAALWGELEQHPFLNAMTPKGEADVVSFERSKLNAGTENIWHNDVTWRPNPSFAAVLRAVEVPEIGGDTMWSDTAVAYDLLPEELKGQLEGLVAEHDWVRSFGRGMGEEEIARLRPEFPPVTHPVVRVLPETGRKALFVNRVFTTRILGLSEAESEALLEELYLRMNRPEFQVRLAWRPNTVAMWDNRSCQHYAVSDYFPQRRVVERISIVGDRPAGIRG